MPPIRIDSNHPLWLAILGLLKEGEWTLRSDDIFHESSGLWIGHDLVFGRGEVRLGKMIDFQSYMEKEIERIVADAYKPQIDDLYVAIKMSINELPSDNYTEVGQARAQAAAVQKAMAHSGAFFKMPPPISPPPPPPKPLRWWERKK